VDVQDIQMGGIDKRLEDLDIVAIVDGVGVDSVRVRHVEPRMVREGGLQFGRPEIGPDQPAHLAHGIGFRCGDIGCRVAIVRPAVADCEPFPLEILGDKFVPQHGRRGWNSRRELLSPPGIAGHWPLRGQGHSLSIPRLEIRGRWNLDGYTQCSRPTFQDAREGALPIDVSEPTGQISSLFSRVSMTGLATTT
jgi:hypothetical protein